MARAAPRCPRGVHGTGPGMPSASRPMLTGCSPSTSLSGSISSSARLEVDLLRGRVLHEHRVDGRVVVELGGWRRRRRPAWRRRAGARCGLAKPSSSPSPSSCRRSRRWRCRRRRGSCRAPGGDAALATSAAMRGARSAKTASATGAPGSRRAVTGGEASRAVDTASRAALAPAAPPARGRCARGPVDAVDVAAVEPRARAGPRRAAACRAAGPATGRRR